MAERLDVLDGLEFRDGRRGFSMHLAAIALDELDRLEQASGSLAFPDFAETTSPQRLKQAISRYRFAIAFSRFQHPLVLAKAIRRPAARTPALSNSRSWRRGKQTRGIGLFRSREPFTEPRRLIGVLPDRYCFRASCGGGIPNYPARSPCIRIRIESGARDWAR